MECEKCIYSRHYGAGDLGCTYFREFRSLKRYIKRPDWCCLNEVCKRKPNIIHLMHLDWNNRLCYACNHAVKPTLIKMTDEPSEVTCKNCSRIVRDGKMLNTNNTEQTKEDENGKN